MVATMDVYIKETQIGPNMRNFVLYIAPFKFMFLKNIKV